MIDKASRGLGYATQLLTHIEDIAKEKKCTFIILNIFSFQAPELYIKCRGSLPVLSKGQISEITEEKILS